MKQPKEFLTEPVKGGNLANLSSSERLNLRETMNQAEAKIMKSKPIKQLPSKELLQELFFYENGILYHKKSRCKGKANTPIGWIEKNGYWATNVMGIRYRVHRIVWQFHYGNCPEFLDHIDCNKNNNSIENLRPATIVQNTANRKHNKLNKLGLKGVCADGNRFKASIKIKGKSLHIGLFKNPKDAYLAYCEKAKQIYGDYAWTNKNLNT